MANKKYTAEYVRKEVHSLLDNLLSDLSIVYLGELIEPKPYSRQRYSEWANEYKDDEDISDTIKKIDDTLETRVNMGGLRNQLSVPMAIFNLKNNYGWKDKVDTDITSGGEKLNVNIISYGNQSSSSVQAESIPDTPPQSA